MNDRMEVPMTMTKVVAMVLVAACALGGCSGEAASTPAGGEGSAHAPPGAVPGSHEDWCGAHEVPESLCTRCNRELVPAFQASGDWCAEHGLPESQCLVCNPDLRIERPRRAGS